MSLIPTYNISFSELKTLYAATGINASGDSNLNDGQSTTPISLSFFRNAIFTDNTSISSSNEISINSFKGKIFGSSNNNFVTDDFNFEYNYSGEKDRLYPVLSNASASSSKTAKLYSTNVHYSYPSILLTPRANDPSIGLEDNAEVWIQFSLGSPFHFQIGVLHNQGNASWGNLANSVVLRNRHTTYNDRIALHTYGYLTHRGHVIEVGSTDELTNSSLPDATTASNYHNRYGYTAGSGNGFTTVANSYYYQGTNYTYYSSYTSNSSIYYIGMKIEYINIELQGSVSSGSQTITNVTYNGSQLSEGDGVIEGLYLDINIGTTYDPIIQTISYSSSTSINIGDENYGVTNNFFSGSNSNITFTAYGQRLEFKYVNSTYNLPKNIGPEFVILPRKYRTSATGSNNDIDSWAFFVGDSTSNSANIATWTIKSENPTNNIPGLDDEFKEISNRLIYSNLVMGNSLDYNGKYDVSETEVDVDGLYRIYIGIKVTASVTYENDISIAAVEVVNSSNIQQYIWIFSGTSTTWKAYNGVLAVNSNTGFPVTPAGASLYTYSTISTGANKARMTLATGTTSSYTGTADGISGSTSSLTVGNGTMSQSSGTYYIYRETSGSTRYSSTVMRSPSISLSSGDKIRVCHALAGYSVYPMDPNDSLYLGVYPASI